METRAPALTAWLDDFFSSYYRRRPVNATFIGIHDHDDRLPDFSEEGLGDMVAEMKTLLTRLLELPAEPLTEAERLDRELAQGFLEIQLWEHRSSHFHFGNPSLYTSEAIFGVMSLFLRPFAPVSQRVESALARMAAIASLLAQARQNVRQAPAAWTRRAIRECAGALAFLGEGADLVAQEEGLSDPRFRREADRAGAAFAEFGSYLDSEILHRPAGAHACGEEPLHLLLRNGHFLEIDAGEVERLGWERLREAESHLETHAGDFGAADRREALAQISGIHPTTERYYSRYQEVWDGCRAAVESSGLLNWPDYPIRFVPQPRWARRAAPHLYFLFYRSPAPFDPVPGVDYLVTPIEPDMPLDEQERLLRATNDSVIKLNHVVHHGGPGHHVQNWHAYRADSRIGRVAAVDCASRIAMFCGGTMAEGWACYATDLMAEIGFLTALEGYAEWHTKLRMAGRAIVDVRLHTGRFTLEEAAAFYRDRIGMSAEAAQAEAVRNSMFPGTALMYLTGTEMIYELRRELSKRPGFELRTFHDQFLSYGFVPVSLVCRAMRGSWGERRGTG